MEASELYLLVQPTSSGIMTKTTTCWVISLVQYQCTTSMKQNESKMHQLLAFAQVSGSTKMKLIWVQVNFTSHAKMTYKEMIGLIQLSS